MQALIASGVDVNACQKAVRFPGGLLDEDAPRESPNSDRRLAHSSTRIKAQPAVCSCFERFPAVSSSFLLVLSGGA
eukprot:3242520-Alexandrium_andersonii.AAC.1